MDRNDALWGTWSSVIGEIVTWSLIFVFLDTPFNHKFTRRELLTHFNANTQLSTNINASQETDFGAYAYPRIQLSLQERLPNPSWDSRDT